jgi:hypothetical protein
VTDTATTSHVNAIARVIDPDRQSEEKFVREFSSMLRVRTLTLGLAFVLVACGATPSPSAPPTRARSTPVTTRVPTIAPPPPAATPTASQVAIPTASPSPTLGILTLGADPNAELAPGVYHVSVPRMTFTIPPTIGDEKWFGSADPGGAGWFIRKATDPCDGCEPGHIAVLVAQSVNAVVAEWSGIPDATLSDIQPVALGGATGVLFEGTVPSELNVAIVHGGYNPHGLVRVYGLDAGGQIVVVSVNQYSEDEPFFEDADQVLQTFRFGG